MTLTERAIEAIKTDSNLRAKLMLVPPGKSEFTINRWVEVNDEKLTMPKYTSVIKEHTGLTEEEILETENA